MKHEHVVSSLEDLHTAFHIVGLSSERVHSFFDIMVGQVDEIYRLSKLLHDEKVDKDNLEIEAFRRGAEAAMDALDKGRDG